MLQCTCAIEGFEHEQWLRQCREEERQRAEAAGRRLLEGKRVEALNARLNAWLTYQKLKEFLTDLQSGYTRESAEMGCWLRWVQSHADGLAAFFRSSPDEMREPPIRTLG